MLHEQGLFSMRLQHTGHYFSLARPLDKFKGLPGAILMWEHFLKDEFPERAKERRVREESERREWGVREESEGWESEGWESEGWERGENIERKARERERETYHQSLSGTPVIKCLITKILTKKTDDRSWSVFMYKISYTTFQWNAVRFYVISLYAHKTSLWTAF